MRRPTATLAAVVGLSLTGSLLAAAPTWAAGQPPVATLATNALATNTQPSAAGPLDLEGLEAAVRGSDAFANARREAAAEAAEAREAEAAADGVTALADEPAPVLPQLQSPLEGSAVAGAFSLSATTDESGRFAVLVDGAQVNAYTGGGTSGSVSLTIEAATPGESHWIGVAPCVGDPCVAGEVSDHASLLVYPAGPVDVVSQTLSLFSPNGDGRRDTTTLRYTTAAPGTVQVVIKSKPSLAVVRTVDVGAKDPGSWTFTWDGRKDSGAVVANGAYSIALTLTTSGGSSSTDGTSVTSDVTAPNLISVKPSLAKFFPRSDNYFDTVALKGTLTERAADVVLTVVNSKGKVVKKWDMKSEAVGGMRQVWNGRVGSKLLPAGTYSFRWFAMDAAGNVRYSIWKSVVLDLRVLWQKKRSTAGTPDARFSGGFVGGCSLLVRDVRGWRGSHGFYSYWYRNHSGSCVDDGDPGLVGGIYTMRLPKAIRYGAVKVSATGQAHKAGSKAGLALLRNNDDSPISQTKTLGSAYGTYITRASSLAKLGFGRDVLWSVAVDGGNQYDIRRFTVTWTYYSLVNDGFRP